MKYLIINKKMNLGMEYKIEEYSKNIFEDLKSKDLIYAELAYEDVAKSPQCFYGDISIELVASPFLELHLCKYIYKVECEKDTFTIIDSIEDGKYLDLLFELFNLNVNIAYKYDWLLLEVLSLLDVNKLDINDLLKKIESLFDKNKYIERSLVRIVRLLVERLEDKAERDLVLEFMYSYLEENIEKVEPLLFDKEDERYMFENIVEEKSPKLYSLLDESLNGDIDDEYLPF